MVLLDQNISLRRDKFNDKKGMKAKKNRSWREAF